MSNNRKEQIEALETLVDFNSRLVKNMSIIVKELSGERLDDTDAFLDDILKAINWEIQVVNGTIDLINENEIRLDKAGFNEKVVALNDAVCEKNDSKIADAFTKIIVVFENLGNVAKDVIAQ